MTETDPHEAAGGGDAWDLDWLAQQPARVAWSAVLEEVELALVCGLVVVAFLLTLHVCAVLVAR